MAGFQDWIKKNTTENLKGFDGKIVAGFSLLEIGAADNKVKALGKAILNIVLMRPMFSAFIAGSFGAMSKSIRSLIADTGSLEAYLKKLAQIQGLQRIFAPLVGGAEAAKRKVAELVNMAASSSFKNLGEWGEAARGLQVFTRGAFAGATALKTVGDAAAATGNGLVQTSDAVGEFYATLRAGEPIANAAEKLRQMGIINDTTAGSLVSLQQGGAGAARVFAELTSAMGEHAGAMASAKGDIAGLNEEHEKAVANLQEKFASPFAASDVENTKNMTAAMTAIAPVVGNVAEWLSNLTGGFSTVKSWLTRTAAESAVLRFALAWLVKGLTAVVAVASVAAGVGLGRWLIEAASWATKGAVGLIALTRASGAAATAITALGMAVRVAAIATGIGAVVIALATAGGIIYGFVRAADAQRKAVDELRKAHEQADSTMKKQIASVATLQERHEALTKALQEQTDAQLALNDAIKGKKSPEEIAELQKRVIGAIKNVQQVTSMPAEGLAPSTEEQRRIEMEAERSRALSEQAFTNEFQSATPGRQRELLKARQADLQARADAADRGVSASAKASTAKADAMMAVAQASASQPDTTSGMANDSLISAWRTEADIGLGAPKDSSLFAETMAQKLMAARRLQAGGLGRHEEDRMTAIAGSVTNKLQPGEQIEPAIANWLRYAAQRRQDEGSVAQLATQASEAGGQLAALEREEKLTEQRASIEREIAELKNHGVEHAEAEYRLRQEILAKELQAEQAKKEPSQARIDQLEAQRSAIGRERTERHRGEEVEKAAIRRQLAGGQGRRSGTDAGAVEAIDLANLGSAAKHFEELRQLYSDDEARAKAMQLTEGEIEEGRGREVASALSRIGGGGNTYAPDGGDVQKQIKTLTERLVGYVEAIAREVATDDAGSGIDASRPE